MANQKIIKQSQPHPSSLYPMKPQSNEKEDCDFCSSMPADRKQLFSSLFRALSKQLQKSPVIYENQGFEGDCLTFRQLLRIVFGSELLSCEGQCEHRRYYTYFIIKLKCNEQAFQFACQGLAEKIAEKNYHLELLSLQVKNAVETIAKGAVEVYPSQEERSETQKGLKKRSSKKSRMTIENSERSIKVEGNEGKQAGVGSEVAGDRLNYFPIYNSDFAMPEENQLSMNNLNNVGYYFSHYPIFFPPQSQ